MRIVGSLLRSTHPGPSLAVTAVAVLLGVGVGLEPWRVAVLGLAMLLEQFSIGLANDWLDVDRDRAAERLDKPAARGEIAPGVLRGVALASGAASLLVAAVLGPAALGVLALALIAGWSYDLGLKATPLSLACYLLGFGALPLLATAALPAPAWAAWWAVTAGALLGAAAHFANVLPDLDDDRAAGIRGLPQLLGRRSTVVLTWAALVAASALLAVGLAASPVAVGAIAVTLALAAVGVGLEARHPVSRVPFALIVAAAVVDVLVLVLAGDGLRA
jgi:4-hydroxybenzoate polyprenyltransferase